ncbi:MAG: hypothetical protein GF353_18820 [Candidatus Lokiarchaeota archaeon]|nr:hypothetical protein [Candidatus Lokiarchaeota archaeon]
MNFPKISFGWIKKVVQTPVRSSIFILTIGLIFPLFICLISLVFPKMLIHEQPINVTVNKVNVEGLLSKSSLSDSSQYSGSFIGMFKGNLNDRPDSVKFTIKGRLEGTLEEIPDSLSRSLYASSLFFKITQKIGIKNRLTDRAPSLGINDPIKIKKYFSGEITGKIYSFRGYLIYIPSGLFLFIGLCFLLWSSLKDLNLSFTLIGTIYSITVIVGVFWGFFKNRLPSGNGLLFWIAGVLFILCCIALLKRFFISTNREPENAKSFFKNSKALNTKEIEKFKTEINTKKIILNITWKLGIIMTLFLSLPTFINLIFTSVHNLKSSYIIDQMFGILSSRLLIGTFSSFFNLPLILFSFFLISSYFIGFIIPVILLINVGPRSRFALGKYLRNKYSLIGDIEDFFVNAKNDRALVNSFRKNILYIFSITIILISIIFILDEIANNSFDLFYITLFNVFILFSFFFILRSTWHNAQKLKLYRGERWNKSIRKILIGSHIYRAMGGLYMIIFVLIIILFLYYWISNFELSAARHIFLFSDTDPNLRNELLSNLFIKVFIQMLSPFIIILAIGIFAYFIIPIIILLRVNFIIASILTFIFSLSVNLISNAITSTSVNLNLSTIIVAIGVSVIVGIVVFMGNKFINKIFKTQEDCPNPDCSFTVRTDMKFCPACGTELHYWDE